MQNVDMKVDEKKQTLTIVVDLSQRFGRSASGKTISIASTQGNVKVGFGDVTMGLNVYTKEGIES
jgi:hypothetical protein